MTSRVLGWTLFVSSAAMLLAALILEAQGSSGTGSPGLDHSVSTTVSGLLYALVGAVIIDRLGSHRVGWLFCAAGVGWALASFGGALVGNEGPAGSAISARALLAWSAAWSPFIALGSVPTLMLFVFPTGSMPAGRWRWFMGVAVLGIAAGIVGAAFGPEYVDYPGINNPLGIDGELGEVMSFLEEIAWPLMLLSMVGGVGTQVSRIRNGTEKERQQIKWFLLAGSIVACFVLFWGVMSSVGNEDIPDRLRGWVLAVIPISVGIAVLKHRLYDIDVIINRALVYFSLSALLALLYLGLVVLLQELTTAVTADSDLVVAGSTLAVAALFRPLRSRTQNFIDQRFYRRRYDAQQTLDHFAHRLRDEIELQTLGQELVSVVADTMQPVHASLWLKQADHPGEPR